MRAFWLYGGAFIALLSSSSAIEITGKVQSASGDTARIVADGDRVPSIGDKAEIFFKLAGADEKISVATARVLQIEGDSVQLKIENATGEVTKDQLVRITAGSPKPAASPRAPATASPPEKSERPRRGKLLFSENFEALETAENGEVHISENIPANRLRYTSIWDGASQDFYAEVYVRPGEKPGAFFGLIFRAAQTEERLVEHYESISIQPDPPALRFMCRKNLEATPKPSAWPFRRVSSQKGAIASVSKWPARRIAFSLTSVTSGRLRTTCSSPPARSDFASEASSPIRIATLTSTISRSTSSLRPSPEENDG